MIKISLILPIYNVEKYLSRCITSCLQQDMAEEDYEIIAVIDGSPDGSLSIAKKFAKQYCNIVVLEKTNGGLSDARNFGINASHGKYVWCIDPDDYIEPNILGSIYKRMESGNLDALWIRYRNINENNEIIPYYDIPLRSHNTTIMNGPEFMGKVMATYMMAWTFIYRKNFLVENSLWYKKGMIYEDTEFAYRALPKLNRIQLFDNICYNYLQRRGSISKNYSFKKYKDICTNIQMANRMQKLDWGNNSETNKFFQNSCTALTILAIKEYIKVRNKDFYTILKQTLLTEPPVKKLSAFGGIKEKILIYTYNTLGNRFFFFILKLIIK